MNDAVFVRAVESLRRRSQYVERLVETQTPLFLDDRFEHGPIDELHHDEARLWRIDDVVNGHDMWVFELRRRLGFANGPLSHPLSFCDVHEGIQAHALDRDVAVEHRVVRAVDLSDRARSKTAPQLIAASEKRKQAFLDAGPVFGVLAALRTRVPRSGKRFTAGRARAHVDGAVGAFYLCEIPAVRHGLSFHKAAPDCIRRECLF